MSHFLKSLVHSYVYLLCLDLARNESQAQNSWEQLLLASDRSTCEVSAAVCTRAVVSPNTYRSLVSARRPKQLLRLPSLFFFHKPIGGAERQQALNNGCCDREYYFAAECVLDSREALIAW